jgi:hypothetical protein
MSEHAIQNTIRNDLTEFGPFWRVNVGQAWTGDAVRKFPDGSVLITNARPFNTGLPKGFADIFGAVPVHIQQDHVGQVWARFAVIEVKTPRGRVSEQQGKFMAAMQSVGALAGVARSSAEAVAIIKQRHGAEGATC